MNKFSVGELRTILETEYGIVDENILKKKKGELTKLLTILEEKKEEEENEKKEKREVVEDVPYAVNVVDIDEDATFIVEIDEEDSPISEDPEDIIKISEFQIPEFGSQGWSEHVLSHLADDEMVNGNPKCDGLRRIIEKLIGPIQYKQITDITPPCLNNEFTSTVAINIEVMVTNENHPLCGKMIQESDIADVGPHNTETPYVNHPSATACTRAEGRAFRKLLRLKNVRAAEEISDIAEMDFFPEYTNITESQIDLLNVICQRCDINVMGYVNSGDGEYKKIEDVPHNAAAKMIEYLNRIQQGEVDKPDIGGYNNE